MVPPLAMRDANGRRYTRPPEVDAAIETSLALDRDQLLRAARISHSRESGFLPLECLVHLVRAALEKEDDALSNALLNILFERCAAMLVATIPDARSQRAADLRQDVMDRFVDKFLDKVKPEALDIFEVRFARAFRMLRIDAFRAASRAPETVVVDRDEDGDGEQMLPPQAETQETDLTNKELAQAVWRLPGELRDAVVLVCLMEYEVESTDPTKKTAATICKVSGRTIRARLANAMPLLKKFMED